MRLLCPLLVALGVAGVVAVQPRGGVAPPWSLAGADLLAYYPGRLTQPDRIPVLAAPLLRVAAVLGR